MLRCAWCMKKIGPDKPCFGLSVKFVEEFDPSENAGTIMSVYLASRNTSVPFIIPAEGSKAKKIGQDGIFAICSKKCGEKMRRAVAQELEMFSGVGEFVHLT